MTNDDARDLTRGGGAGRIALSYLAVTGILAIAVLLMKLVIAWTSLGPIGPADF